MNLEQDIRDITDKLFSAADAAKSERWREAHGFIAEARALLSEVQSECFYKWHTPGVGPV